MAEENLNIIATHPIQSEAWAHFREAWGNEVIKTKYGLLTLHKIPFFPLKLAIFLKGPKPTKELLKFLISLGIKEKLIFIKMEPNYVPQEKERRQTISLLTISGAVKGKRLFTPATFIIDLTKSEEELFASFHPKTRYNIRVAQKNKIKVVEDNSDKAFNKYLKLTEETVIRQGFYAHTEKYHKLMWKFLHQSQITNHKPPIAHLLTAVYKGEIITTWIVFVWKDCLYYPYGASTDKYKNVMANNLIMWEAIRFGKKLGLKTFDLWGREEGKGFTRFKEGYNPNVVEFLGSWDLVINKPLYYFYQAAESLRWIILRLKAKLGFSKYSF